MMNGEFHSMTIPLPVSNAPRTTRIPQVLAGLSILLIDDEPDNVRPFFQYLVMKGAAIHIALNGPRGIELLVNNNYTLALIDIQMPVVSGFDVIKRVRSTPHIMALPCIAVTALSDQDKPRILAAGFDAYLGKPFDYVFGIDFIMQTLKNITGSGKKS